MIDQKKPNETRTFITDERGSGAELVIEKLPEGYAVSVLGEEIDGEHVDKEDEENSFKAEAIRELYRRASTDEKKALRIEPSADGWTIWELCENDLKPPRVEFAAGGSPDEHQQIDRLFRVLGGEELSEDKAERPIDAGDEDRALVFPHGRRSTPPTDEERRLYREGTESPCKSRDVYPSDLLAALYEIAALVDGRPGDPGRGVHLVRRVESVLEESERRGGKGR